MAEKEQKPVFAKRNKKSVKGLTEIERLRTVLRSQGITRAAEIAELPADVRLNLAKLCNAEGALDKDTNAKAQKILDAYYDSQKASVDRKPEATPEVK